MLTTQDTRTLPSTKLSACFLQDRMSCFRCSCTAGFALPNMCDPQGNQLCNTPAVIRAHRRRRLQVKAAENTQLQVPSAYANTSSTSEAYKAGYRVSQFSEAPMPLSACVCSSASDILPKTPHDRGRNPLLGSATRLDHWCQPPKLDTIKLASPDHCALPQ